MNQKDYFNLTQQEVADALEMSRANVGQHERQALQKLKKTLEERGITAEDFFEGVKK
jgi:DNA-directed RNA polymerase specialized sigma24 family protein